MKIGFVGLGKLGLPCAVAVSHRNHDVMGYDVRRERMSRHCDFGAEAGFSTGLDGRDALSQSSIRFGTLAEVVNHSELLFVAIQTPHREPFDGTHLLTTAEDFDYSYLIEAVQQIAAIVSRPTVLAVISTVLPGTIRTRIAPLLGPKLQLVYNPSFIAMGTTMRDFVGPEFVLLGVQDEEAAQLAERFYRTITAAPIYRTSIENAELIKTLYNTFICMKVNFANCAMEICHKTPGANVDAVTDALKLANRRLLSEAYLSGGMGDGGGCHPRDNIAMSWLARKLSLSCDPFWDMMSIRQRQTGWLADLMEDYPLPKAIVGYSFKVGTAITTGSPALLLKTILESRGHCVWCHDPLVEGSNKELSKLPASVFLIGTRHESFRAYVFPPGSVVIDPWRYLDPQPGVRLVQVGVGSAPEELGAYAPASSDLATAALRSSSM